MESRADWARRLHAGGLGKAEVARHMGLPFSTVFGWLDPDHLAKQRARRARYRGTCVLCGESTDGSRGYGKAPMHCAACAPIVARVWTEDSIIAAMQLFAARYGRQPTANDFSPGLARYNGRPERADRFLEDGDYPTTGTVIVRFGSWSAGIAAAGFTPRKPGVYDHSTARPRRRRSPQTA